MRRRLPEALFLQRDLIAGNDDPAEHRGFATHAVCSEVLEHVDDPGPASPATRGPYMADGCRLVVTVPGGPTLSAFDVHIGGGFSGTHLELQRSPSHAAVVGNLGDARVPTSAAGPDQKRFCRIRL